MKAGEIHWVRPRPPHPADARERWYALHRARREQRRYQERHAELLTQLLADPRIPAEVLLRATDHALNPPYIIDPQLPGA